MEKRYDVAALGELLIDFTRSGVSPQGNPLWEANPGGAPCNVRAMLTRLGHTTAFLGKVGQDGSRAWCGGVTAAHPGFKLSNTVETTGAGDTFMGCALHYVLANGWHPYTEEELSGLLRFANAAAAIITTRPGALRVMPKAQEIKALLELTKR